MENLKEKRERKGLSQTAVALAVGVSRNAYCQWEYGVSKPNEENLKKLEELLGDAD